MNNIELYFEHPALLLAAIPAALFVAAAFLRRRRGRRMARGECAAAALRVAEVILLAVVAAGPGVVRYSSDTQTVVLADRSASVESVRAQTDVWLNAAKDGGMRVMEFAAMPSGDAFGLNSDGTDIAAAIQAADAAFSGEANRRMVLISDGVPTQGDALAAADAAAKAGIRLDAVQLMPEFPSPQAEVSAFELPAGVMEGRYMEGRVDVLSDTQTEGVLRIWDGDAVVHEQTVDVAPGRQTFSCALKAGRVGAHTFRAELTVPGDALPQNDSVAAGVTVTRGEKFLLVDGTGGEAQQLEALLREDGTQATVVAPQDVPANVDALCEYGLIVLMNVDVHDLPDGWDAALLEAVSVHGRSLLTTGGEHTYLYGGMKDSPYEAMLPVRMSVEERESVEPMALMLVIDTTDSMTRESVGKPIDMAKRGAINCVEALNGNDYAGVITFSDEPELLVEMTAMQDKAPVLAAIDGIETASADRLTRFSGALRLACDTLQAFDGAQRKHVMFITDGSPADAQEEFERIAMEMRDSGVTLSTIVVGRLVNVVKMLDNLAAIGGGRCYLVESGEDLSDMMSVDSVLSQVQYTIEKPFKPLRGAHDAAWSGEEELPQLFGYVRTTVKGDAGVVLKTPEGRPVYATRNVGAGRTASWMSDLNGNWSRVWFASEQGRSAILRMLHSLMPETLSAVGETNDGDRTREYDLLGRPDGGMLLMEMCARTGGTVFATWEEAAAVELPPAARAWDAVLPLAVMVMLCLLTDIALRRLKTRRR